MNIVPIFIIVLLVAGFLLGRTLAVVAVFGTAVLLFGASAYRVHTNSCDVTWVLDHSLPVNLFCGVKK